MNYHNITYPDMNNGDGLRVILWLSGCSHRCKGCQNPQTWDANSGIPFDEKANEELFRELDKEYISGLTLSGGDPLNEANLDGVLDIVTEFNKRYKQTQDIVYNHSDNHNISNENADKFRLSCPNKTIWIYSGFTWENIWSDSKIIIDDYTLKVYEDYQKRQQIISQCDILVDGRYIDSQRNPFLKWRGSKNQRVIDIQESIKQNKAVLYCD